MQRPSSFDGSGASQRAATPGQASFAAVFVALGIAGLTRGDFPPIWTGVPHWLPARPLLVWSCAFVSLGCGLGLLWRRSASVAARVLLVSLLLWVVLFRVPLVFRAPMTTVTWWAFGETAVMVAAALVLCARFDGERRSDGPDVHAKSLRIARALYGLSLIPFGIAHFTFLDRTVGMVPAWLPWHLAWAVFTGGAMIAAGAAILTEVLARLAAVLSAWELGAFTLFVWGPVVVRGPGPADWSEFVVSVALTAGAWVVAESYDGMGWVALRPVSRGSDDTGAAPVR